MSQTNEIIERFTKMAEADPGNELGHFSLGKALLDVGRNAEAAASFERVIQLNPNMSRVYQMLGTALARQGQPDAAIARLTEGLKIAQARGETLPKNEMISQLRDLGGPVPEELATTREQPVGPGQVLCRRCGQVGRQLKAPPMRNAFGKQVFESICGSCWQAAIGMGTKVINELRLPLDDPQATKIWDQHIREFLNLEV